MALVTLYRFWLTGFALLVSLALITPMAFAPLPANASPTTWFVSSASSEGNGTSDAPFATVAEAITAATPGDTIRVLAGDYSGFTVNKALTILGPFDQVTPGPGSERTPGGEAKITSGVQIAGSTSSVTISGFSLQGSSETGIRIGTNTRDVTLSFNEITGFDQGIRSQGNATQFGDRWSVSHNYIHDLAPTVATGSFSIHLRNVKNVAVSDNIIVDSVNKPGTRRGILLRGTENAVVTRNRINLGFTPTENPPSVLQTTDGFSQAYYAIAIQQKLGDIVDGVDNGDDLSISNVDITDNFLSGAGRAINLFELDSPASDIFVARNTVERVYSAVVHLSFDGPADNELLVQQNDFSGATIAGVEVYSLSEATPAKDQFAGIAVQGNNLPPRGINAGALTDAFPFPPHQTLIDGVDARGNWWGTATGPVAAELGGPQGFIDPAGWITSFTLDSSRESDAGFWPVCSSITTEDDLPLASEILCPPEEPPSQSPATTTPRASSSREAAPTTSDTLAPGPGVSRTLTGVEANPIPALNSVLRLLPVPSSAIPLTQNQAGALVGGVPVQPRLVPAEEVFFPESSLFATPSRISVSDDLETITVAPPNGGTPFVLRVEDVVIYEAGGVVTIVANATANSVREPVSQSGAVPARAGDQLVAIVSALPPGVVVRAFLFSTPIDAGLVTSDGDGNAIVVVDLPNDFPSGAHTLQLSTANQDGELVTFGVGVEVSDTAPEPASDPAEDDSQREEAVAPADQSGVSPGWVLWLVAGAGLVALAAIVSLILFRRNRAA